jgi:hypothetical protein
MILTKIMIIFTSLYFKVSPCKIQNESNYKQPNYPKKVPYSEWIFAIDSQGHCHSHDKNEGGKNKIRTGYTVPLGVVELSDGMRASIIDENHTYHG